MSKVQVQVGFLKFSHEAAVGRLTLWDDGTGHVSGVYSRDRGKGYASIVMTDICKYADDNLMVLTLEVQGYSSPSDGPLLSNEELEDFYSRHGFRRTDQPGRPILMRRLPHDSHE